MSHRTLTIGQGEAWDFTGYLVSPPSGQGPGVLLLQEVYGLNADIRAIADRIAAAGFTVLAPDVFWRKAPGVVFDYADRDQAIELLKELGGADGLFADVAPAFQALAAAPETSGDLGVVGIGFGSVLAAKAIAQGLIGPIAGVTWFGGRLEDVASAAERRAAWQHHFAAEDAVLPPDIAERTRSANAHRDDVEVHVYPGVRHGFAVPGRLEFDAAAAEAVVGRTLDFLRDQLVAAS